MAEVVHYVSFFAKGMQEKQAGGRFSVFIQDNELKAVLVRGPGD